MSKMIANLSQNNFAKIDITNCKDTPHLIKLTSTIDGSKIITESGKTFVVIPKGRIELTRTNKIVGSMRLLDFIFKKERQRENASARHYCAVILK